MSTARILGKVVLNAAASALSGTIVGSVGAKILRDSYDGYVVIDAVRAGAVGGSIIGAGVGVVKGWLSSDSEISSSPTTNSPTTAEIVGETVIQAGVSVLGGMLGKAILGEVCTMSVGQIAAAMATGAGVLSASGIGLGIAILCCACGIATYGESAKPAAPRV